MIHDYIFKEKKNLLKILINCRNNAHKQLNLKKSTDCL